MAGIVFPQFYLPQKPIERDTSQRDLVTRGIFDLVGQLIASGTNLYTDAKRRELEQLKAEMEDYAKEKAQWAEEDRAREAARVRFARDASAREFKREESARKLAEELGMEARQRGEISDAPQEIAPLELPEPSAQQQQPERSISRRITGPLVGSFLPMASGKILSEEAKPSQPQEQPGATLKQQEAAGEGAALGFLGPMGRYFAPGTRAKREAESAIAGSLPEAISPVASGMLAAKQAAPLSREEQAEEYRKLFRMLPAAPRPSSLAVQEAITNREREKMASKSASDRFMSGVRLDIAKINAAMKAAVTRSARENIEEMLRQRYNLGDLPMLGITPKVISEMSPAEKEAGLQWLLKQFKEAYSEISGRTRGGPEIDISRSTKETGPAQPAAKSATPAPAGGERVIKVKRADVEAAARRANPPVSYDEMLRKIQRNAGGAKVILE